MAGELWDGRAWVERLLCGARQREAGGRARNGALAVLTAGEGNGREWWGIEDRVEAACAGGARLALGWIADDAKTQDGLCRGRA